MGTLVERFQDLDDWEAPNDEDIWDDEEWGTYEAYLPDRLDDMVHPDDGALAMAARAERELGILDDRLSPELGLGPVEWLLLRSESLSSTHIEGIRCTTRDLLVYDGAGILSGDAMPARGVAEASTRLWRAIREFSPRRPIDLDDLCELNESFLIGTPSEGLGGSLRTVQNWIGDARPTLRTATFVPPPPDEVEPLMEDLLRFCNESALPSVAVAAMSHAQFETIHPFADGNGRTGRALIQLILRSRGVISHTVVPLSAALVSDRDRYVAEMLPFQTAGHVCDPNGFIRYLCRQCVRASRAAMAFQRQVGEIRESWGRRVRVRRGSVAYKLLDILPYRPVLTVGTACEATDASERNVRDGLQSLTNHAILEPVRQGTRTKAYVASDIVDLLDRFEAMVDARPGKRS